MKNILTYLQKGDIESIEDRIKSKIINKEKTVVITVNSEHLQASNENLLPFYKDPNTFLVADGIAVTFVAKKKKIEDIHKIPGVSVVEFLLTYANDQGLSVGVLGASKESIACFSEYAKVTYPNIKKLICTDGYVDNPDGVLEAYSKEHLDIVLVAFGVPKQEVLIKDNLHHFDHGVFVGVGGSIDVIGGFKRRAPGFFLKTNTEWLYRIVREPKRIIRFFKSNLNFMFRYLKK